MDEPGRTPLEQLGARGHAEVAVTAELRHLELHTMRGLLTVLWHGDPDLEQVVVTCGGASGGVLGPAGGLYHELGTALVAEGTGTLRVGYRRPNHLEDCVLDVLAAVEMAIRSGARRVVTMGHSFGGAVAVQAGVAEPRIVSGVVTLATQAAGCEVADQLAPRPFLLLHGSHDQVLPAAASELVRMMAEHGELVVVPGADHGFTGRGPLLLAGLLDWVGAALAGHPAVWAPPR